MPKSSINSVIVFIINELGSFARLLRYGPIHQKLLTNGCIIDNESVRLVVKELCPLSVEQRAQHRLTMALWINGNGRDQWLQIRSFNKELVDRSLLVNTETSNVYLVDKFF